MLAENVLFSSSCCMSVLVLFSASVTSEDARKTASSCWLQASHKIISDIACDSSNVYHYPLCKPFCFSSYCSVKLLPLILLPPMPNSSSRFLFSSSSTLFFDLKIAWRELTCSLDGGGLSMVDLEFHAMLTVLIGSRILQVDSGYSF